MTRIVLPAYLLLLLLSDLSLYAQGFRMFSGRNHPEIHWSQHETEHFVLVIPEHLLYLKAEAATIAEETYAALSNATGVAFDRKIRVYLSDEDEIVNGFAVPFGGGYTNIWVNQNESASVFTGDVKWLRKVLAHELTHIFHFEITKSNIGLWGNLFGEPMPRFWSEGWAQYRTERWDSERGDRWLRTAVFDNNLSLSDNGAIDNGRMVYALGNAQMRFFHEVYGDSAFNALSKWRDKSLPYVRYNDFYRGFKKATGVSYATFNDRWRKHVNIFYHTLASTMERTDSIKARPEQPAGTFVFDARVKPGTDTLAVLNMPSIHEPARDLTLAWKRKGVWKNKRIAEGAILEGFSFSPDGAFIAFARTEPDKNGSFVNKIFVINLKTGHELCLTPSGRAAFPVWISSTELLYVQTTGRTANLVRQNISEAQSRQVTSFSGDVQITGTAYHAATGLTAFSVFLPDGKRHIALVKRDETELHYLGTGAYDDRNPRFSIDGQTLYTESLRDDVPNIFAWNLATKTETRVTVQFAGARLYDVLPIGDSLLAGVSETRRADFVYRIPVKELPAHTPQVPAAFNAWTEIHPAHSISFSPVPDSSLITKSTRYSSWKHADPLIQFAIPDYNSNGFSLTGFSIWSDPLAHHMITGIGTWMPQADDPLPFYLLGYVNNHFRPTINLSVFKVPSIGQFYGGSYILNQLTGAETGITLPVDVFHRPYSASNVTFRFRSAGFDPVALKIENDPAEQTGFEPEALRQTDFLAGFVWTKKRPARSIVHPLDAFGIQIQATGGVKTFGGETSFIRPELQLYANLRTFGRHTLLLHGRGVYQQGTSLAQDFVGFSRYDNPQLSLPANANVLLLATADRVRGHRRFIIAEQTAFASAEYRIPLLPDLHTTLLGIFSFEEVALSLFVDAGYAGGVKNLPGKTSESLTGFGFEFKNTFSLGGLKIGQAIGAGYKDGNFSQNNADWHYRLRASLPF
jgi:hypothetical protein